MRNHRPRFRLVIYGGLTAAIITVAGLVRKEGGVERASPAMLAIFSGLAIAWAIVFVGDVAWHAWKREGYACIHCGRQLQMRAFRLEKCPHCGQ
jgi:hypothetical protein